MARDLQTHQLKLRHMLRDLMRAREISAAQLARNTKVPKSVISDWLAGTSPRNLPHLMRVAQTLGVSIETLCFGIETPKLLQEGQRIKGLIEGEFIIIKRH